jgi:peptidoglycan hydrolase CwlO-like protein
MNEYQQTISLLEKEISELKAKTFNGADMFNNAFALLKELKKQISKQETVIENQKTVIETQKARIYKLKAYILDSIKSKNL